MGAMGLVVVPSCNIRALYSLISWLIADISISYTKKNLKWKQTIHLHLEFGFSLNQILHIMYPTTKAFIL